MKDLSVIAIGLESARPKRRPGGAVARQLLVLVALSVLGCAAPDLGTAAADTCQARFEGDPGEVVTYSPVAESGDETRRIDVCRGPEKEIYDPDAIRLQFDEYTWDKETSRWQLTAGAPRTETGPCEVFTEQLNIIVAAKVRQLLCSESAPVKQDPYPQLKVSLHGTSAGCWKCFAQNNTVFAGSAFHEVYCQVSDYSSSNKKVHLDSYTRAGAFQLHISTFVCPNIGGLSQQQVNLLCGNPLPQLSTCP
jgi:hypothetical protein